MAEPKILVPISSLNQFTYCPRRCWYIHVAQEFIENVHTLEGRYAHERSDSGEVSRRGDLIQTRSVYVHSARYGLTGRLDVLDGMEEFLSAGELLTRSRSVQRS